MLVGNKNTNSKYLEFSKSKKSKKNMRKYEISHIFLIFFLDFPGFTEILSIQVKPKKLHLRISIPVSHAEYFGQHRRDAPASLNRMDLALQMKSTLFEINEIPKIGTHCIAVPRISQLITCEASQLFCIP